MATNASWCFPWEKLNLSGLQRSLISFSYVEKYLICVNKDNNRMLFSLLKFMVAECGCNRTHRALKGDISAEPYSFPSSLCLFSVRQQGQSTFLSLRGLQRTKRKKWFPGCTLIWGEGWIDESFVTGSCGNLKNRALNKRNNITWCNETQMHTHVDLRFGAHAHYILELVDIILRLAVSHALFSGCQLEARVRTMSIVRSDND